MRIGTVDFWLVFPVRDNHQFFNNTYVSSQMVDLEPELNDAFKWNINGFISTFKKVNNGIRGLKNTILPEFISCAIMMFRCHISKNTSELNQLTSADLINQATYS